MNAIIDLINMMFPIVKFIQNPNLNNSLMLCFTVGILSMAIYFYLKFNREINKSYNELATINSYISGLSADSIATNYEEINNTMLASQLVGSLWREYDKSLVKITTRDGVQEIYSTADATCYFNNDNIISSRLNLDIYNAVPGFFTGLGIFGTFLGLTVGLSSVDLGSSDVEVIKDGIKNLLGGMATAFSTSLWGLLLALPYSYWQKRMLNKSHGQVHNLQDKIDLLFSRKTSESWLSEGVEELRKQSRELQRFNTDLAMAIGEALEVKLNQSFGPTFEKLLQAITDLSSAGADKIAESINENAGNEIASFGNTLKEVQSSIKETIANSNNATKQLSEEFEERIKNTANNLADVFERASSQQQSINEVSNEQVKQMFLSMQASMENTRLQFETSQGRASEQQVQTLSNASDSLIRVANELEQRTKAQGANVEQLTDHLSTKLQDMVIRFSDIYNSGNDQLCDKFEERINNSASNMAEMFERASFHQQQANVIATEQNKQMFDILQKSMRNTSTQFEMMHNSASESLIKTASELEQRTKAQGENVEQLTNNLSIKLQEIVERFSELSNSSNNQFTGLVNQFERLIRESSELMGKASMAATTFHEAAGPVRDSSKELQLNLRSLQDMQNQFTRLVTDSQGKIGASTITTNQSLDLIKKALEETRLAWDAYDKRFGILRKDLEGVFDELQNGLKDYQKITGETLHHQLKEFDSQVASAIGHLGNGILELGEVLEGISDVAAATKK